MSDMEVWLSPLQEGEGQERGVAVPFPRRGGARWLTVFKEAWLTVKET